MTWILAGLATVGCSSDGTGANAETDAASGGETQASGSVASSENGSDGTGGESSASSGSGTSGTATTATTATGEDDGSTSEGGRGGSETDQGDTTDDATTQGTTTGGEEGNALHVADFGQDSNPGTPDAPMRTLQWALGQAELHPEIDTIRVAGGTYNADVANDATIVMVEGVSLLGGWNESFDARDPQAWPSRVVDSSAQSPPGTSENNPARVVEVPAGVTPQTVFDGFRVQVGRGQYRTALYIEGDATISGNSFERGPEPNAVVANAMLVDGAAPVIAGNRIDLDYESSTSQLRGITVRSGDPSISNNVITLAGASFIHYGIELSIASPDIVGNSIEIRGGNPYLIRLISGSQPRIENNLLQGDGSSSICVASFGATSVPTALRNNLLQCDYAVWGNGDSPIGAWQTIAQVHAGVANASGNVKLLGLIVDAENDLRLDANTPCSVARGGLDLSDELPQDFTAMARTAPLSMGAHEWDGACQ